ncbi:YsnF/AvaK domain-containing protein [Planococcus sp. ISL-110]|uniref:YsnF/AvaK domain-containing protein n=1 Tax=Planococcus sp. ISL-110 TaxID=2819167 RepID=UPI001BE986E6|nr:YsnF/AvaK domain-containing protein [Planococcus sp. ISL-110]MBT2570009.1 YsnF/AvaK domain-containing protein [Planococcus sp. ISL-110]
MTNKETTLIQAYDVQAEVLHKISELKAQGYQEEDMYVIAKHDEQLSMVQGQTDVHLNTQEDEDMMSKFKSFISGEDSTRDAFTQMGLASSEADEYYRQVENGKLVLYVNSDYGTSYKPYNGTQSGTETASTKTAGSHEEEEHLRLHEERLNVDKESVQTGEVNVGKHVVEEQQTIEVPVEREEVYVERRPVNEEANSGTDGLTDKGVYDDGETIHIPVSEERVEVSKKDVVSEEIVVGKRKVQDTKVVNETVRREEADIDEQVTSKKDERNSF